MGNRGPSDKALVSFNAGELSPLLDSRTDLEKASSGCRVLENMIVETYGSARRRPGTQYISATRTGDPPDAPDIPPPPDLPSTINGQILSLAVQSDGKILIGAEISGSDPVLVQGVRSVSVTNLPNFIYRINPSGSIDESFLAPAFRQRVGWLFVQPSGKILVVALFSGGTNAQNIMRLNQDGSQDTGYIPPTGSGLSYVAAAAMLSDGRLFLSSAGPAGSTWSGGFGSFFGVPALLQLNGALDTGFAPVDPTANVYGPVSVNGLKLAVQWINADPEIFSRITAAGAIDKSYTVADTGEAVGGMYLHTDGRLLVCTHHSYMDGTLQLFAADGTRQFFGTMSHPFGGSTPLPIEPGVYGVAFDGTNYILTIIGSDSLLKCTPTGTLVDGFYPTFDATVQCVVVNSDGSMWVAGDFSTVNGFESHSFTLLHSSGYKMI